jgi:hypothetical protein
VTTEPTPNIPLLRKTLDWVMHEHEKHLRGEPSEWDQQVWINAKLTDTQHDVFYDEVAAAARDEVDRVDVQKLESTLGSCGTVCCVAGKVVLDEYGPVAAALIDKGFNPDGTMSHYPHDLIGIRSRAADLLGLTDLEAEVLFHGDNDYEMLLETAQSIANRAGETL